MLISHIIALRGKPNGMSFSGAENHLETLLLALKARGETVELVVIHTGDNKEPSLVSRLKRMEDAGIVIRNFANPSWLRGFTRLNYLLLMWRIGLCLKRKSVDIFHIHLDLRYLPVALFLRRAKPIVASIHNDRPEYASRTSRFFFRLQGPIVQHYIAISERVKEHFENSTGVNPEKISTIYYGYRLSTPNTERNQKVDSDAKRVTVGFVGRLTTQKNVEAIICAAAMVPDADFVIIGDGAEAGRLKKLAHSLNCRNVCFKGAVPDAAAMMNNFDIFCLPSRWEGLGLVLIEAMLQGVPIIGSTNGAIPDILGHGQYGYICEPTADNIARAIQSFIADPKPWKKRAEQAVRYAQARFDVGTMTEETLKIYYRCASK